MLKRLLFPNNDGPISTTKRRKMLADNFLLNLILTIAFICGHIFLIYFFFLNPKFNSEKNKDLRFPMPTAEVIHIGPKKKFEAGWRVKEMYGINEMSLEDPNLTKYLNSQLKKYGLPLYYQPFTISGALRGKEGEDEGLNVYTVLPGKRTHERECYLITFNYQNSLETGAVLNFIQHYRTQNDVIPYSIIFAGLDPNFKNYGKSYKKFYDHYASRDFQSNYCTLLRKGVSLNTVRRKGPQNIVVNPYGHNEYVSDLFVLVPLMNSIDVKENSFQTKVHYVEDNRAVYRRFMNHLNYYILGPINRYFPFIQKVKSEMIFASMFSLLYGAPNEPQGYLMESGLRAIGIKLNLPPNYSNMAQTMEDLTRHLYLAHRAASRDELYMFRGSCHYLVVDKDRTSKDNLPVILAWGGIALPAIYAIFEMLTTFMTNHDFFIATYIRTVFLVTNLYIASNLPSLIDSLLTRYGLKHGALCSYKETLVLNGLMHFGAIAIAYFGLSYLFGWVIERTLTRGGKELRPKQSDRMNSELLVSKVTFIMTMHYMSIGNLTMSFISSILVIVAFIPMKRLYGLRIILFGLFLAGLYLLIMFIGPWKIIKLAKKSITMQACLGESRFYTYIVLVGGTMINYLYCQSKSLFLI